jgi:hypothetical protein
VAAGDLVRVRYGAYVTGALLAAAETDPCLAYAVRAAAVRATGSRADSVVSHHSAARILGLSLLHEPPGEKVSLTVPPGARTGRGGDVLVHEASLPPRMKRHAAGEERKGGREWPWGDPPAATRGQAGLVDDEVLPAAAVGEVRLVGAAGDVVRADAVLDAGASPRLGQAEAVGGLARAAQGEALGSPS